MQLSASVLVVLMLLPSAARGQTAAAALPRVDVAAATGWFAADRSIRGDGCCSSWSSSLFKGLSAGYYWTEHLKTEVELAAPGPTEGYTVLSEQLAVNRFRYISEEHSDLGRQSFAVAGVPVRSQLDLPSIRARRRRHRPRARRHRTPYLDRQRLRGAAQCRHRDARATVRRHGVQGCTSTSARSSGARPDSRPIATASIR